MSMIQGGAIDLPGGIRLPYHEVGVAARSKRTLPSDQPGQARRTAAHPLDDVGDGVTAFACPGPYGRESELKRGDATPRAEKIA
jgi:hypothetical protein